VQPCIRRRRIHGHNVHPPPAIACAPLLRPRLFGRRRRRDEPALPGSDSIRRPAARSVAGARGISRRARKREGEAEGGREGEIEWDLTTLAALSLPSLATPAALRLLRRLQRAGRRLGAGAKGLSAPGAPGLDFLQHLVHSALWTSCAGLIRPSPPLPPLPSPPRSLGQRNAMVLKSKQATSDQALLNKASFP
jgi:hypothetical protein